MEKMALSRTWLSEITFPFWLMQYSTPFWKEVNDSSISLFSTELSHFRRILIISLFLIFSADLLCGVFPDNFCGPHSLGSFDGWFLKVAFADYYFADYYFADYYTWAPEIL
jgi:hypothetical protein